jgi:hypothetical protein
MKKFILSTLLFVSPAMCQAQALHYPFDVELNQRTPDLSINQSDGLVGPAPAGRPHFHPPLNGQSGYYEFDDDNQVILSETNTTGNLGTNDFLISFWYWPESTNTAGLIAMKGNSIPKGIWFISQSSAGLYFRVVGARSLTVGIANTNIGPYWQHIVIARTNQTYVSWLDGVRQQSTHAGSYSISNTAQLTLGATRSGDDYTSAARAKLDMFRIYTNQFSATLPYDLRESSRRSMGLNTRDTDSDGLPDWWEEHYFSTLSQTASMDPDQDNFNNRDEFLLGMNPLRPAVRTTNDMLSLRLYTPVR